MDREEEGRKQDRKKKYTTLTRIALTIIALFLFTDGIVSMVLLWMGTLNNHLTTTTTTNGLRCDCTNASDSGDGVLVTTGNQQATKCRPIWKSGPLRRVFVCKLVRDDESDDDDN